MAEGQPDLLQQFSDCVAARTAAAQQFVAAIEVKRRVRSAILWGGDVVVASEQVFPKTDEAVVHLPDGRRLKARIAGRDSGTNVVALRLEQPVDVTLPSAAEPRLGALVLAMSATGAGAPAIRLGIVRAVGPAWHSLRGGLIDRRVSLDLSLSAGEEGGPVLAANGGVLGMSATGPSGRALVIPTPTIARVLEPLLTTGRIDRGWLGLALYPVALPDAAAAQTGQHRGLMVMRIAGEGPAAKAGVQPGDILLAVGGEPALHARELGRGLGPDSIGKATELRVLRGGVPITLAATITARPAA